jgi:DHA3 family macrolide efflux protein-like MFS transporter
LDGYLIGVICGICSAFFNPAISSVIPDLVSNDNIVKANSAQQMAVSTTSLVGSLSGGFIYSILGASVMFIFNGISYIISTVTEMFISIPKVEQKESKFTFREDFKEGLNFTFGFRGLVVLLAVCFALNFFFAIFSILLRPWFMMEESLGVARYGVISAFQSIGMIVASILLTNINIKAENRAKTMLISLFLTIIFFFLGVLINKFHVMCVCFSFGLFFNTISNTVMMSSMMVTVPQDMRGKVMSIVMTCSIAIQPIGTLIGGVLGDIFYPRSIMIGCFLICMIGCIPLFFSRSTKKVLNYNPEIQSLEDIKR